MLKATDALPAASSTASNDNTGSVRALGAALSAAVVGFIVNLAVWFGIHVMFRDIFVWQGFGFNLSIPVLSSLDIVAAILAIAAAVAIFRIKVGIMLTLLACSLAGVALQLALSGSLLSAHPAISNV